jgi:hypothetical protein
MKDKESKFWNKDVNFNIKYQGFDNLALKLGQATEQLKEQNNKLLKELAKEAVEKAKKKKPVLPSSIDTKKLNFYDGEILPPVGLVTDWTIDIDKDKTDYFNGTPIRKIPKMGQPQEVKVDYKILDDDFLNYGRKIKEHESTHDGPRFNWGDTVLNKEKSDLLRAAMFGDAADYYINHMNADKTKHPNLPKIKGVTWVIDDLIPEDMILVIPKDAVIKERDKNGKEVYRLNKKYKGKSKKKDDNGQ